LSFYCTFFISDQRENLNGQYHLTVK
jgi:hypothetical protein